MVNPPFPRQTPNSPHPPHSSSSNHGSPSTAHSQLHHHATRKPSIVELLSSPPPLPNDQDDSIHHLSLSRNTSISSRSSSHLGQPPPLAHLGSGSVVGSTAIMDWGEIPLSELTESNKLISISSSDSVQSAFETLLSHNLTSVPVSINQEDPTDLRNCLTFDYSDLNTYLLLIMNKIPLSELSIDEIGSPTDDIEKKHEIIIQTINKAKKGEEVPVEFIIKLHPKNPFIKFTESDLLSIVMETLGNGVHRIAITDESGDKITGILSQRRLIRYMWENARRFPSLDFYLTSTLQDLKIGSNNPITIYEDQLLIEALLKMFNERVSSLAVIDRTRSLVGNISIVDVKNVTSSKNSHLLFKSVLNFVSYNLSQKGIEEGQDQFPIFHVDQQSSLGRVIAKLVATQSHRLWIVDSRKPSGSGTPSSSTSTTNNNHNTPVTVEGTLTASEKNSIPTTPTEQSYGFPGKLIGVVSLTDILGLFATSKGKKTDPQFARNQRRRSSSSTTRSSIDSGSGGDGSTSVRVHGDTSEIFRKSYCKHENVFSSKD
ncbi:SDS23 [[Candida] subhashii]|uniref:SDS23 n=1 Tax=[Candida] subhashii TaxID=561895 RepID=A0A8J5QWQ5_9ASCO|nr:SDS23 [[Candida] subhashii]KAG7663655.1 SDS23 [[Candida] subhashii]